MKYMLSNTQTCPYLTGEGKLSTCTEFSKVSTVFQTFLTFLALIPIRSQIWPPLSQFYFKISEYVKLHKL